jgi:hypothetical protein
MALFYAAYFDASATSKRTDPAVLTVAGAIAPVKKWIRFEHDWKGVLKDEGVTEFHATDFAASQGEYAGWKGQKERRASFLKRLGTLIQRDANRLFMITVELDAWKEVNKQYFLQERLHSPFALGGLSVLVQARKWARRKKIPENKIEFIFEQGDLDWGGLRDLAQHHKFDPIELPKAKAVPCQIGDLVAWKYRIAAVNSLRQLNKPKPQNLPDAIENLNIILKELASLDKIMLRPGFKGIYSEKNLIRTCEGSKIPKRSSDRIITL